MPPKTFSFGKYKGLMFNEKDKKHIQYLAWIIKNWEPEKISRKPELKHFIEIYN